VVKVRTPSCFRNRECTCHTARDAQLVQNVHLLEVNQLPKIPRFIGFLEAPGVTGEGLSRQILNYIWQIGLDPAFIVGQGYDGTAAMSGHLCGVQKKIHDQFPLCCLC